VKFADWSEQMVQTLGEEIRPHLEEIYNKAVDMFNSSGKKIKPAELSQVEKITERVIKSKQIVPEEADQIRALARKVSELSGDVKIQAGQDLQMVLQALERPTMLRKVSTAQTIAQLLNPKTLVRNTVGNEAFWALEKVNRLVTAPIDWTVSKFTGKREVTFLKNNQWDYWRNWLIGAKAGWKGVNPEGLSTQYDLRGRTFSHKWNPLTYMEKVMGASLQSFDYASYKRAVGQTLDEMARLDAVNKGLKGEAAAAHVEKFIRNVDVNLTDIAEKYGQYVTFQDTNLASTSAVKAKRLLNLGQDFGLGDVVLKYPRTPANLLMRALEYSPAGFLRSGKILADIKMGKGFNQREFALALSRAITGSLGFTGMGYFLTQKGILTDAGNKDRDIRELEKSAGKGAYQVNVTALRRFIGSGFDEKQASPQSGDNLITYDWMQPIAVSLALGAGGATKSGKLLKGEKPSRLIKAFDAVSGASQTLIDQSFLQGIQRAFDFQPNQTPMDKAIELAKGVPASFVPTAVNQIRQVTDPDRRITNYGTVNSVKNRLPGISKTLPADYGTLGKPKQTYQDNSLFNVFINPAFTSKYNPSPDAKLVIDLIGRTGDKTVAPRVPGKTLKIGKETHKLTSEQYSRLQKLTGEETSRRLKSLTLSGDDGRDVKRVLKILDRAGEIARNELKKEIKKGGQ
jgi:hypothetical protein